MYYLKQSIWNGIDEPKSSMNPRAPLFPLFPLFSMDKRWVFPFLFSTTLFIFLLATSFNMGRNSSFYTIFSTTASTNNTASVHSHINSSSSSSSSAPPPPSTPLSFVPRLAYFVSGSKGDLDRVWRLLQVIYHPRNQYVVHLDLESPAAERSELALRIANETVFAKVGNVHVIAKANMVTYRGATMVANTLHACAILLKKSKEWDWFINLSASDYPLVTQDGKLNRFFISEKKKHTIRFIRNL